MSNFVVPNIFIPGTKAKAQEVNENFLAIVDKLNTKSDSGGDKDVQFLVSTASEANHAVPKSQVESLLNELKRRFFSVSCLLFPMNGYTNNLGEAEVVGISASNLYFNVGTAYKNLEFNIKGVDYELFHIDNFDITGFADGDYNIFVDKDGEVSVIKNKIYVQPQKPSLLIGDIWVDTSCSPAKILQSEGSSLVDFEKIAIGSFTIENSVVKNLISYPFNYKFVTGVNNNLPATVTETYTNGDSWYRLWSDGWLEQGGSITTVTEDFVTIQLLKPYKDTNYMVTATLMNNQSTSYVWAATLAINNKTVSSFQKYEGSVQHFQYYAAGYCR